METTTIRECESIDVSVPRGTVSVCLLGQSYWASKLEDSLNQCGGAQLQAFTLPLNARFFTKVLHALTADVLVRMGFRAGAPTWRGRAFDAFWSALRFLNPNAVRVFYWLGTDVLDTTEDLKAGKLSLRYHRQSQEDRHLADAPWLVDELREAGIEALCKTLTLPELVASTTPELPCTFSVLTYVPDRRFGFYGGKSIYEAAKALPDVRFDVVGGTGAWLSEHLPNLLFHGWQSDMTSFHRKASVLVRMVQHDGTGLTVLEALILGRHVIYSYPLPHTIQVGWGDTEALIAALRDLFDLHQRGVLGPNKAGSAYVQNNFNHHDCMDDLVSYLVEVSAAQRSRRVRSNGR